VDGSEGGVGGDYHGLAVAVAPHERLVGGLRYHGRDVAVVDGRDVHDPAKLLYHPGRGTAVGLVASSKLSVGVSSPSIEVTFIGHGHGVSVSANNFSDDDPLKGGDPTRGQLVDVIPQTQLAVAIVAPAVHVTVF